MPQKHFQKRNQSKSKLNARTQRAKKLLLPTANSQYGTTAIAELDLSPRLVRALSSYNTIGDQVHRFRQFAPSANIVQTVTTVNYGAFYFTLAQIDEFSTFNTLFDQYCIEAVEVEISAQSTFANTAGSVSPRLYTVLDYDDAIPLASLGAVRDYESLVISPPNTGIVRTLIPAIPIGAQSANGSATVVPAVNRQLCWIDSADTNVPHYGLKYAVDSAPTGQTNLQTYSVDFTIFVKFKNVR
jgi:hypothetical protein